MRRIDTFTRLEICVTGNASDSDGGEARDDLLGIGYGSDGAGSEGAAALKQVRHPAAVTDLTTMPTCSATLDLRGTAGQGSSPPAAALLKSGPGLVSGVEQPLNGFCRCEADQ